MRFYKIVTFGCQMNVHESEKLAGVLEKLGYISTQEDNEADIVVFNTCAIRENAQNRAISNVGNFKQLKKQKPNLIIAVCGCMTQQKNMADKIYNTFPFVDIIFGTHNISEFENFVLNKLENNKRILSLCDKPMANWENYDITRTSGKNAWVNIMYGCNNYCTYCIVPYVRGPERSREKEYILNDIKNLVTDKKYETITLLGQNVNSYGTGLYTDYDFADLLTDICKIEGDFKLTFMTSHPKDISPKVMKVMANENKIIKELHLPVQSGSNSILKKMNRKYTVEEYLEKVNMLRSLIPNIRLSTDIIVGFPGETEDDFNDTCELIKLVKYENIFAFMYSVRSGTAAEKMDGHLDQKTKNKRVNYILNLQKKLKKER